MPTSPDDLDKALAQPRFADCSRELVNAYLNVFTRGDGPHVLRDLFEGAGFFTALPSGTEAATLADHNARRALLGRIFEILSLTPEGREAIAGLLAPALTKKETT